MNWFGLRERYERVCRWAEEFERRSDVRLREEMARAESKGWMGSVSSEPVGSTGRLKVVMLVQAVAGLVMLVLGSAGVVSGIGGPVVVFILVFAGVGLLLAAVRRFARYERAKGAPPKGDEQGGESG